MSKKSAEILDMRKLNLDNDFFIIIEGKQLRKAGY